MCMGHTVVHSFSKHVPGMVLSKVWASFERESLTSYQRGCGPGEILVCTQLRRLEKCLQERLRTGIWGKGHSKSFFDTKAFQKATNTEINI